MGVHRTCLTGLPGKVGSLAIASVVCVAAGDPALQPQAEPVEASAALRHAAPVHEDGGALQGPASVLFRGFENYPLGLATVTLDGNLDQVVVANLTVTTTAGSAAATTCTAPSNGVDVCLLPVKQAAGDNGVRIEKVNTRIPDDVTSYYVQLEEYWGSTITDPDWETDPMPVGFRTSGGSIIACADFDQCPIYCNTVEVQFVGGDSPGKIECPAGDLFSISDSTTVTLRTIFAHGLCPGGGGSCSEATAKARARLEFRLRSTIDGWTPEPGCTVVLGSGPTFSANRILIRPVRSSCAEAADDCTPPTSCGGVFAASDGTTALGGTTPPILSVKLLAETFSTTGVASTPGEFRIWDEAVCTTDGNCPPFEIPTVSAWGIGILAIALCVAAAVLLRRAKTAMVNA